MKKEMKRTARLWMLFAVITLLVVGCTDDNINPTTPEEPDVPEEVVKTASEVLKEIEGVSNIKEGKDEDGNSITSFLFEQPIDHKNPAAGSIACCTIRGLSTLPYCTPTAIPSRHRKKQR